jgi:hypothetical protein
VKENGEVFEDPGDTVPAPFSVIVTEVALPPKLFPATTIGSNPHWLSLSELSTKTGPFTHPQLTVNIVPVVTHPSVFLTVMK